MANLISAKDIDIVMNSTMCIWIEWKQLALLATGKNPESGLVEVVELKDHPYFVGVQYHPELKSTVENPHPLFVSFIKAALQNK
jgi:CTP synthase